MSNTKINFSEAARRLSMTHPAVLRMRGRYACVKEYYVDTSDPSWDEILSNRMMGLAVDGGLPRNTRKTGRVAALDFMDKSDETTQSKNFSVSEKPKALPEAKEVRSAAAAIQQNKAVKLRAEAEKAELDVRKRKDELVEKAELGEVCFSYLEGANLAMLSMPESIVDNIIASVQAKGIKARPDLISLLTKEISRILDKTVSEQELLFKKKSSTLGLLKD